MTLCGRSKTGEEKEKEGRQGREGGRRGEENGKVGGREEGERQEGREVEEGEGMMLYMYTYVRMQGYSIHTYKVVLCPGAMNSGRCIIGVLKNEGGEVLGSS